MTDSIFRTERVTRSGMTLSKMIWLLFKRPSPGYMELVLPENPGLSSQTFLEIGTEIKFPLLSPLDKEPVGTVIKPWD